MSSHRLKGAEAPLTDIQGALIKKNPAPFRGRGVFTSFPLRGLGLARNQVSQYYHGLRE